MVSKNVYYHLRNIASIRNTLCVDSAKALVHAFISSRLDYCNSLLYSLPKKSLDRLQRVQNMAARLIDRTSNTVSTKTLTKISKERSPEPAEDVTEAIWI